MAGSYPGSGSSRVTVPAPMIAAPAAMSALVASTISVVTWSSVRRAVSRRVSAGSGCEGGDETDRSPHVHRRPPLPESPGAIPPHVTGRRSVRPCRLERVKLTIAAIVPSCRCGDSRTPGRPRGLALFISPCGRARRDRVAANGRFVPHTLRVSRDTTSAVTSGKTTCRRRMRQRRVAVQP